MWTTSGCGSHYFIRDNAVVWSHRINPCLRETYENAERDRMVGPALSPKTLSSLLDRLWRAVSMRRLRK